MASGYQKSFYTGILFLFSSLCVLSQNLVPNPDFETFTSCPPNVNQGGPMECTPWYHPTDASSDYFNVCGGPNADVPNNLFGTQNPHSGVAYAGLGTWFVSFLYREYLSVQLIQPLLPNTAYEVSFYVSLADNNCGTDKMGAYFSVNPTTAPGIVTLPYDPQVSSNLGLLTDKINWTLITGCFAAKGGEQYITIGNFFSNADTHLDPACGMNPFQSYYYIDDVSVVAIGPPEILDVDLGGPVIACGSYVIDPNLSTSYHYHWEDGSIDPTLTVTESGTYAVTISDGCAFGIDSVEVTVIPGQTVDIGPPTHQMCVGDTYVISLDPTLGTYLWQDGSTATQYTITTAGTYSVTLDDGCFPTTDMVVVTTITPPPPNFLGNDTTLCPGEQIPYIFNPVGSSFLWQNGFTLSSYTITHSGLYALTISNICGVFTDNINVVYLQPFQVDLGPDQYLCSGDDFDIDLDPTLGDFLWQDGNTQNHYSISTPGTYSVTVTNQCETVSDNIQVFASVEPVIDLGPDQILCQNQLPYNLDLSGIPQAEYLWQDGSTLDHFLVNTSGTYSVTVTNTCFSVMDDVEITIQSNAVEVILPTDQILCNGETFTITNSGDIGDYLWQDNSTSETLVVSTPGTYSLTVTTFCGTGSDNVEISFVEPAPFPDLGSDLSLCPGQSITLSPQIQDVTYVWQDLSTADTFHVTTGGTYSVTVSSLCNSQSDHVNIDYFDPAPDPQLGPDEMLCPGDQLTLTPHTTGDSYVWQDLSTADTLLVTSPGTYIVTVSSICGSESDTVAVQYLALVPVPDLGPDASLCPGEQIILSPGISGVSYIWQDLSTADSFLVTSAGMYFLKIFNLCDTAFDTIQIAVNNNPPHLALPAQLTLCQGQDLTINSGISGVSYLWNDNSNADSLHITVAGSYSLTVSNACGTAADTVIILDGGPAPFVSIGSDVSLCPADHVMLSPAFSDVNNWLWNDGSVLSSYTVTGNEIVTVEVSNNCGTAYDTLISTLLPATPPIDLGHDTSICPGSSLTLSINTPNVNIQWSDGSVNSQFLIEDEGNYYATISNLCGANADTIHIALLPDAPVLHLGIDQSLCPGETITLDPGISNATYLWQDGSTNTTYTSTLPGTIILQVANVCGMDRDTLEIFSSTDGPQVNLGPDILACEGDVVTIESDISGVDFLWQDGSTNADFSTSNSGSYILQVSNNCGMDSDTVNVEINGKLPDTYLGADTVLCSGTTLLLSSMADPGTVISWQDGSSLPTFLVASDGMYILSESNHCGVHMDSVLVSYVNAPAAFDLGSDTTLCPGESLMLTAPQTNDNIVWQDGSFSSFIIADQAQIYSLVISNLCGKVSDQFSLSFDDHTPVLNLPPMSFLCLGDELEINATQPFPATYLWNTGSVLPSIEVDSPGMYSVDVHTDCTDIHGETEVLTPDTCFGVNSFFIPNIFSPNGDNVNDVFSIKFNSDIQVHALQTSIFDRWGNMVFESDAVPFEWNGEFNGRSLDPGVYVYRIEMRYFDRTIERVVIVNGDVTLIR